jgi:hypothetical protein
MDQGRKKTSLVLSSAHSLRRPYNSLPGEGSLSRGLFLSYGEVFSLFSRKYGAACR